MTYSLLHIYSNTTLCMYIHVLTNFDDNILHYTSLIAYAASEAGIRTVLYGIAINSTHVSISIVRSRRGARYSCLAIYIYYI